MSTCLEGIVVLELGNRAGVGFCGSLLSQLGAKVISAEAADVKTSRSAPSIASGKLRLRIDNSEPNDLDLLRDITLGADVILISSDDTDGLVPLLTADAREAAIVCDITAFGVSGPLAGQAMSDELVQAYSGLLETTGDPRKAPLPIGVPITEFLASINAAGGILAALRTRRKTGRSLNIDISMFDSGLESMSTFLARAFAGKSPTRVGNRHPNIAPFNTYRAKDGLLNLCTGSDDHWRRLCGVIGRPELAIREEFATNTARMAAIDTVDSVIETWTLEHSLDDCIMTFLDAGIPAGPVTVAESLAEDRDLLSRGVVRKLTDPSTGSPISVPGSVFAFSVAEVQPTTKLSAPGEDRDAVAAWAGVHMKKPTSVTSAVDSAPLAGLTVVEVGQYTTGPRAARQLAALGAEVIKVEVPPNGDPARTYAPFRDGQSYFFHLNNSGKQTVLLDLKSTDGVADLRKILAKSDVLIENLKPGALKKLGLGADDILRINPKLVYCSISGYGTKSVYRTRPGMDSVVQGMTGLMDVTRSDGLPYKGGVSISDVVGGQLGFVAIMAALEFRERTQIGQFVDVSMFDASTWLTQLAWSRNGTAAKVPIRILKCSDGYIAVAADSTFHSEESEALLQGLELESRISRAVLIRKLESLHVCCAPVLTVAEALAHPHTESRGLIAEGNDVDGKKWPYITSPVRVVGAPVVKLRAAGKPFDDQAALFARFGLVSLQRPREKLSA